MSKKMVLLVGIIFLLGLTGVVSAATLFTEDFGTTAFDKSKWVEVKDDDVTVVDRFEGSEPGYGGDGFAALLPPNYQTSLTMIDGLDTSEASEVVVDLWAMLHVIDDGGKTESSHYIKIFVNDKDNPDTFSQYGDTYYPSNFGLDTWSNINIVLTDPAYMFDGFKVRLSSKTHKSSYDGEAYFDEVTVTADFSPTPASVPSPIDGAKYELTSKQISWTPGNFAVTHDVYLGTDFDDVNDANNSSVFCVSPAQVETAYSPTLEYDTTYYWRIDENYDMDSVTGTLKGDVWSFTTMPSVEDVPTDPNLVGWWKMDGADAYAWDYTGRGNHGVIFNAEPNANGKIDGALKFVRDNSCYIDIPAAAFSTLDDKATISFWCYGGEALPVNNNIFNGVSAEGPRTLNSHMPYGDLIHWQAGQDGSSYEGISKSAVESEYKGQWNQWVFTKDTDTGEMKMYLNGELWHSGSGYTMSMAGTIQFAIGSKVGGGNYYDGLIDDFRVYDSVISIEEIKAIAGNHAAYNFSPENGAVAQSPVLLEWDCIAENPLYNVYFSDDFNDINDSVPSALLADEIADPNYIVAGLDLNKTYYWAVDVNDNGTIFMSPVIISFETPKSYAADPSPVDGAPYKVVSQLSWTPSTIMISQDVYLGTDPGELVLIADDITDSNVVLGTLEDDVTYYWKVDTTTSYGVDSLGIWSFTAGTISDPNLVGWWKLDEADGETLIDSSGYGYHGTVTDANRVAGQISGALEFDGNGDYADLGADALSQIDNEITIVCWQYGGDDTNDNTERSLMGTDNTEYKLLFTNTSGQVQWAAGLENIKYAPVAVSEVKGQWNHWVFTKDRVATEMKTYLNGELVYSETGKDNSMDPPAVLRLGDNGSGDNFYDGMIDDVRIYDRVLNEAEIGLFVGKTPPYDLTPAYGAVVPTTVTLDWECFAASPTYDVYLSTDFNDVNDRTALVAGDITESSYEASGLAYNTVYYWTVDVNNAGTIYPALAIMSFTTGSSSASNPTPADGAKYIAVSDLSWTPSDIMISQDVYFSTNSSLVTGRDPSALVADDTTGSSVTVGAIADGVTYYWLVDTTTAGGVNSAGSWSFIGGAIEDPNLVGWWKMDDDTAAYAWDYSGYGHHGSFMGTAAIVDDPCSIRGKVLVTDGNAVNAPYVQIDDFDYTNSSNEFSLGYWFRANSKVVDYLPYVFNHGSGELYIYNNVDMYLRTNEGGLTSRIILDGDGKSDSAERWQKTSDGIFDDGQWRYYTVTLSADGTATAYLDGEIVAGPEVVPNAGRALNPTQDIILGAANFDGTMDRFFDGDLDDVRMYNKVLSEEEIWTLADVDPPLAKLRDVVNNWLTAGPDGDLNADGIVDLLDFNMASQQWGWQD